MAINKATITGLIETVQNLYLSDDIHSCLAACLDVY